MGNNPRMTKQDISLAASAIRRVFSRSELRRRVLEAAIVSHSDPSRPRVKCWVQCAKCKQPQAKSSVEVDHNREPVIPIDSSLHAVIGSISGWDYLFDRIWCDNSNLQVLCESCHDRKSQEENKIRRRNKKNAKR